MESYIIKTKSGQLNIGVDIIKVSRFSDFFGTLNSGEYTNHKIIDLTHFVVHLVR